MDPEDLNWRNPLRLIELPETVWQKYLKLHAYYDQFHCSDPDIFLEWIKCRRSSNQ